MGRNICKNRSKSLSHKYSQKLPVYKENEQRIYKENEII